MIHDWRGGGGARNIFHLEFRCTPSQKGLYKGAQKWYQSLYGFMRTNLFEIFTFNGLLMLLLNSFNMASL